MDIHCSTQHRMLCAYWVLCLFCMLKVRLKSLVCVSRPINTSMKINHPLQQLVPNPKKLKTNPRKFQQKTNPINYSIIVIPTAATTQVPETSKTIPSMIQSCPSQSSKSTHIPTGSSQRTHPKFSRKRRNILIRLILLIA